MSLFKKKKYVPIDINKQQSYGSEPIIPDGLWVKCSSCGKTIYKKELGESKICPHCQAGFRLSAKERIEITVDEGSFIEYDENMIAKNPMSYPDYEPKLKTLREKTGINDAVVCGICSIKGVNAFIAVMDGNFIMGSMGSVVGEKITRIFEHATKENLPVIVFTVSGGARMQEGIISLMQMAKVSAAVARHSDKGLLYITVLTDPTTGGVTASFAMLGDIILSEPKAVIGFAGRRVIEQTIRQTLPDDFQTAEFVLEHGFIDKIVPRNEMREVLYTILKLHHK